MELKKVSEIYEITPDFRSGEREKVFTGYYSHWCHFIEACATLSLKDSVVLIHGPQGCTAHARTYLLTYYSQYFGEPFTYAPTTDMRSTDTILGAEGKLREAIKQVDSIYKPRIMFVLTTCASGVIKEPVEDVVEEMKDQIQAKIMAFTLEGFKTYGSGWMRTYMAERLADLFQPPKEKIPNSVNILGITKEVHCPGNFPVDSQELERLLNKLGLKVNSVLLQTASLEDFYKATEAQYNVLDCPQWGYPMAKNMEERFGVPHGMWSNPLGVTAITHWLMEVAQFFGIEEKAKGVIKEEYENIKRDWERAKEMVAGKIALIDGADPMSFVERGVIWARMCTDLGMRPILYNIPPLEVKSMPYEAFILTKHGFDPEMVYSDYSYHRRLSPIEVIRSLNLNIEEVGLYIGDVFPFSYSHWEKPIFDPSNVPRVTITTHCSRTRKGPGRRVGFRGAGRFAKDLINAVKMGKRKEVPTFSGRLAGLA